MSEYKRDDEDWYAYRKLVLETTQRLTDKTEELVEQALSTHIKVSILETQLHQIPQKLEAIREDIQAVASTVNADIRRVETRLGDLEQKLAESRGRLMAISALVATFVSAVIAYIVKILFTGTPSQ